ncbi:hypothetical protein K493DRAFT_217746 [Basidiobolus meristosporus CBS 931.73]|uniref:HSF-type DNA-binding domain-containing protein n=1 Tax=Basidiobolus meristosporus CBS 931.73 TaxID=1314790 RepID=A0A1Y1YEG2_9FUNG|nr:hypothetical protein K493DRAFT_217746 [Basidiobolus meristosporus CBS 931.73]|eukprot:ORX96313.1 hypothetical protein K493DRAFT_217746 [Basidiobolus meristosporus CBS 931.73]
MNPLLQAQSPNFQIPQFAPDQIASLPPSPNPAGSKSPSSPNVKIMNNTFVHKLHGMVEDKQYQHLISWNYSGTSFIVCNIVEFSREVLPKHFKHNNFSSFVRQLNMYGFHKVNKSPRGHRTLAENQIWEFSHPKFLRGRPDLLDDIKRKSMESETLRRETGDLHAHITMMQVAQSDMMQQLANLQQNLTEVVRELSETKRKQDVQQQMMKNMFDYIQQQSPAPGSPLPPELNLDNLQLKSENDRPPIYITTPDGANNAFNNLQFANQRFNNMNQTNSFSPQPSMSSYNRNGLQIQVDPNYLNNGNNGNMMQSPLSPVSLQNYNQAVNTPLPPSPMPGSPMGNLVSDDDINSPIYSSSPQGNFRNSDYAGDGDALFDI